MDGWMSSLFVSVGVGRDDGDGDDDGDECGGKPARGGAGGTTVGTAAASDGDADVGDGGSGPGGDGAGGGPDGAAVLQSGDARASGGPVGADGARAEVEGDAGDSHPVGGSVARVRGARDGGCGGVRDAGGVGAGGDVRAGVRPERAADGLGERGGDWAV